MKVKIILFISVFMLAAAISPKTSSLLVTSRLLKPELLQHIAQVRRVFRIMDTTLKIGPAAGSRELLA
jgi:hypothetical protein